MSMASVSQRPRARSGTPGIWLCASAVTLCLMLLAGLLLLVVTKGLHHFWPKPMVSFATASGEQVVGTITREEHDAAGSLRYLVKIGNRDVNGLGFRWYDSADIVTGFDPGPELTVMERLEWGNAHGVPVSLRYADGSTVEGDALWPAIEKALAQADELKGQVRELSKGEVTAVNRELESLRLEGRRRELADNPGPHADLEKRRDEVMSRNQGLSSKLGELHKELQSASVSLRLSDGSERSVTVGNIVRMYRPNDMNPFQKTWFFLDSFKSFILEEPREANTEGGVYPAIYGTVLLVFIMSLLVMPLGVITAVYLHEYARSGPLIRLVRISVNNLAGVPSIVYGVFGLGFFVYFIGSRLDAAFYQESLPTPVFGTPGLLWSSLTLALLTVPVVVVATEEGLSRVPRAMREGSLALGATRAETLWRTILPACLPAILTGQILAVARAAGEVAPLMLVGVVKHAPDLPVDGHFPFIHLERKFMHLGFHIYDVGFQSPNVEAARPLVYATAMLLITIVLVLNMSAVYLRSYLRKRYNINEAV